MKVVVEEHNPLWAKQFQEVKQELEACLEGTPYLSIEHVGSTSVPGLAAKPILDIDIVIERPQLPGLIAALTTKGGYEYRGDLGITDREAFRKVGAEPARNLYTCIEGSQALRNHLAVRDLCRSDPYALEIYAQKKRELAAQEWPSVDAYAEAKNEVLQWLLARAGFAVADLDEIRAKNIGAAAAAAAAAVDSKNAATSTSTAAQSSALHPNRS